MYFIQSSAEMYVHFAKLQALAENIAKWCYLNFRSHAFNATVGLSN